MRTSIADSSVVTGAGNTPLRTLASAGGVDRHSAAAISRQVHSKMPPASIVLRLDRPIV
eukprot:m.14774 g.14774  ORF g.14774 m.14774 type:complete len:59 (+) comp7225_c0_seq1:162-338(+)